MDDTSALDAPSLNDFQHEPLDPGRRLIRLITVLPDLSKDGLIQCRLKHGVLAPPRDHYEEDHPEAEDVRESYSSNIEDEEGEIPPYICLSYTWGNKNENHAISINGRLCTIRRNLWDFLAMASENLPGQFFWIDALCIDQNNTSERNHQVQQMGNIYTRAKAVIVWLGSDLELELTLHAVNLATKARAMGIDGEGSGTYGRPWNPQDGHISACFGIEPPPMRQEVSEFFCAPGEEPANPFRDGTGKVEKLLEKVTTHTYWSRAWVTQEVLLSRNALVVAGHTVHNLMSLAVTFRNAVPYFRDNGFESLIDIFIKQRRREVSQKRLAAYFEKLEFENWGLINLLHRFKNKNCAITRDRIYSLLALCKDGAKLKVDYSVSEEQIMRQVLSLRESSMCFCSAGVVSNALSPWDHKANDQGKALEPAFAEVHMYAYALTSAVCPFCSNWVPFSWTRKKGLVFCLGLACPDTQGHFFWETPSCNDSTASTDQEIAPNPGSVYAQSLQNNKSQLLCRESVGIAITKSEWPHVYQLQFTLPVLVQILQQDLTTGDLGLNACGNLWPNAESKAASGLQRLRLCGKP